MRRVRRGPEQRRRRGDRPRRGWIGLDDLDLYQVDNDVEWRWRRVERRRCGFNRQLGSKFKLGSFPLQLIVLDEVRCKAFLSECEWHIPE